MPLKSYYRIRYPAHNVPQVLTVVYKITSCESPRQTNYSRCPSTLTSSSLTIINNKRLSCNTEEGALALFDTSLSSQYATEIKRMHRISNIKNQEFPLHLKFTTAQHISKLQPICLRQIVLYNMIGAKHWKNEIMDGYIS